MRPKVIAFALGLIVLLILATVAGISLYGSFNKTTEDKNVADELGTNSSLDVNSEILSLSENPNGSYTISYLFTITNTGQVNIHQITATNNLNSTFSPHPYSVTSVSGSNFATVSGFNGNSNINLLAGNDSLAPGEAGTITLTINFFPEGDDGPYNNSIAVYGVNEGDSDDDNSQGGDDDDNQGNDDDDNNSGNTPTPTATPIVTVTTTATPTIGVGDGGDGDGGSDGGDDDEDQEEDEDTEEEENDEEEEQPEEDEDAEEQQPDVEALGESQISFSLGIGSGGSSGSGDDSGESDGNGTSSGGSGNGGGLVDTGYEINSVTFAGILLLTLLAVVIKIRI